MGCGIVNVHMAESNITLQKQVNVVFVSFIIQVNIFYVAYLVSIEQVIRLVIPPPQSTGIFQPACEAWSKGAKGQAVAAMLIT